MNETDKIFRQQDAARRRAYARRDMTMTELEQISTFLRECGFRVSIHDDPFPITVQRPDETGAVILESMADFRVFARGVEAMKLNTAVPPEGAVPVRMIAVLRDGVTFQREDGQPIEYEKDGYYLMKRNRGSVK